MDFSGFVVQFLNGLAEASSLFLVAAGLSLIFGVTRIVNFAHGSLYMIGLYLAYTLVQAMGHSPLGFWVSLIAAALLVGALHAATGRPLVGLLSGLRLLSATMLGAMLTVSTRFSDLLSVAEALLAPLGRCGVPVERLALQLGLMMRFAEQFFVQWGRLADAYRIRTGRAGGLRLLAPLTIRMLVTARKVADALSIRLKL